MQMPKVLSMAALFCSLIHQLGNDSFLGRERAHTALLDSLPVSADYVKHGIDWSPTVEGRVRCHQILQIHWRQTARGKAILLLLERGKLPWVSETPDWFASWPCYRKYPNQNHWDSIGVSPAGYFHYLELARWQHRQEYLPVGPPDWPEWRTATYFLLEDLFLDGWDNDRVGELLDAMKSGEDDWKRRHG